MRSRWVKALVGRVMNAEGYIHTQQHDGLAHAEGWPFPSWAKAGGLGWHFRGTGVPGYDAKLATPEGWTLTGGVCGEITDKGLVVKLSQAGATAQPPGFSVDARASPWLRLNWWATGLQGANCYVSGPPRINPSLAQSAGLTLIQRALRTKLTAHAYGT